MSKVKSSDVGIFKPVEEIEPLLWSLLDHDELIKEGVCLTSLTPDQLHYLRQEIAFALPFSGKSELNMPDFPGRKRRYDIYDQASRPLRERPAHP